jgi:hypothetical protein
MCFSNTHMESSITKKQATDARLAGDRRGVWRLTPNPSSACVRGCDRHGDVTTTDAVHGTVAASVVCCSSGVLCTARCNAIDALLGLAPDASDSLACKQPLCAASVGRDRRV